MRTPSRVTPPAVVAVLLVGCIDGLYIDDDLLLDLEPTSDVCADMPPDQAGSVIGCWDIGPSGRFVADRLKTLWGTEPALICAYVAMDGRVGACGPLPPSNAMYCPNDDVIAWDIDLLNAMYWQAGDFASAAFIAHEWGHLNQARAGMLAGGSNKSLELHADCQAGVFAAVEESAGLLTIADPAEAQRLFCEIGDPYVSDWFAPGAHGTCDERAAAFAHGYGEARARLEELCFDDPLGVMREICG